MTEENNKPKLKLRDGQLTVTVWENKGVKDGNEYTMFNYSLAKGYKDKEDNWKTTNTYNGDEVLRMSELIKEAKKHLCIKIE